MSKENTIRYKKGMKDTTDWDKVDAMADDDSQFIHQCTSLDDNFWATMHTGHIRT